jgi:hypothetical protein
MMGNTPPGPLDLSDDQTRAENWMLWRQQWDLYEITSHLKIHATKEFRSAMFLKSIGMEALKVHNTWPKSENDTGTVEELIKKFEAAFIGERNETYERYRFQYPEAKAK